MTMVAGKVKSTAVGYHRSPASAKPKPHASHEKPFSFGPAPAKQQQLHAGSGTALPRSFGVYSPRAPPDVEELRARESRLKAERSELKLLREAAAIVPVLENVISSKDSEIERFRKKIECLEAENLKLRQENEVLHVELATQNEKIKRTRAELSDIKRSAVGKKELEHKEPSSRSTNVKFVDRSSNAAAKHLKKGEFVGVVESAKNLIPEASDQLVRTKSRPPQVPNPPPPPPPPPIKPVAPPLPCTSKAVMSPPPPPASKGFKPLPEKVSRVPEVVEFYHSVMGRDSNCRRDSRGGGGGAEAAVATAEDMIGEIKTRSAHLLAIKTDVETQGDFIRYLIKQVEGAAFSDIEGVVAFVKWLDDELSTLVDERAVLKHFNWPEKKADALREAAFGYCDLKKLETAVSSFLDDPRQPCSHALKKMKSLFDKLEHGVYTLSRVRESAADRYKSFQIPVDWMLDTGYVSQMKLASVKLAMKYMKRVSAEIEMAGGGTEEQELIVQGVKFAFRVHQFAGGFDAETMRAFQELRAKAR